MPAGGKQGLGRVESCVSAMTWFWNSWAVRTVVMICVSVMEDGGNALGGDQGRAGMTDVFKGVRATPTWG